jgi:DME family drug/metabolite transporter
MSAPDARSTRLAAALAVVAASVLFGTTGTAQALGPPDTTPLGVGAVRLAFGAAALAVVALARTPAGGRRWRPHLPALLTGGVAVAAYHVLWFAGLRRTGVALGTIVGIGSGPVFAGLLHLVINRTPLSRAWTAGTALTVAGAALLGARGAGGISVDPIGLACVLGSGLGYAVYADGAKRAIDGGLDAPGAMAGVFVVAAVLTAPILVLEPVGWVLTPRGAALGLHLGLVTLGLGYTLYGWALHHLQVPTAVTLTLAEPLTAALLGMAFLGERLALHGWIGVALIAAGLLVAGRAGSDAASEGLPIAP